MRSRRRPAGTAGRPAARLCAPARAPHVADHADDLALAEGEGEVAADRGSSFGQWRLTNDSLTTATNGGRGVSVADVAPARDRNAERREEARRHVAQAHAFWLSARVRPRSRERRPARCRRASAIGRTLTYAAFGTPGSARTSGRTRCRSFARAELCAYFGQRQRRLQRQHALGAEPGIPSPGSPTARGSAAPRRPAARPRRQSR